MESVNLYKRMWKISTQYYSKAYLHLGVMVFFALTTAFLNTSIPFLMKIIIDKTQSNQLSIELSGIFTLKNLYFLVMVYAFAWLLGKLLEWIQNIASLYLSNSFEVSLLDFGLRDFLNTKKGVLDKVDVSNFVSDANRASSAFSATNTTIFLILFPTLAQTFFMCWYLYKNVNGLYSLFFVIFAAIVFVISQKINQRNKKYLSPIYTSRNKVNSFFLQKASSAYDIKTNNAATYEADKFRNTLREYVTTSFYNQTKVGISLILQVLIVFLFLLLFMLISAYLFGQKNLTSGTFILISSYIVMLTTPFLMLSQQLTKLGANVVSLLHFQTYLDMPKDQYCNKEIQEKNYFYKFKTATLTFGKKKIENFTFEFLKEKKYAIIGETGIGKTTLVNYLLGLEKVEKGNLYYQTADITEFFNKNIFKDIAFVGQKNTLYNGTLRENLIYNTEFPYTDEDILFYIRELFLECTLKNNNIDLNSSIDEVYKKFSGGECQRLNIIRALLRRPKLLILDEPTSALDEQTAKKILNFLKAQVSSIILVTHAQYCIDWVDEIINMNELLEIEKNL